MQAGGDILVTQKEDGQNPFAYDLAATGASLTTHAMLARTNFRIHVQKIVVLYVTHANAKAILFEDTAAVVFWKVNDYTSVAGVPDVVTADLGPHGYALAISTGLDIVEPGSGSVASIHIEGYYKLATPIFENVTANTAV